MSANAELNETLLNAMFALNEAGDNLDEIYRIGLETAVSLLNADCGCIFQRDEWHDDKWTVAKTINLDKNQANSIATAPFISQAATKDSTWIISIEDGSETAVWYQSNSLKLPGVLYLHPSKTYKWTTFLLYLELEHPSDVSKVRINAFLKFGLQLNIFMQKAVFEWQREMSIQEFWHDARHPIGLIIGFANVLSEGISGVLNSEQTECVEFISNNAKRLLNLIDNEMALQQRKNLTSLNLQALIEAVNNKDNINAIISDTLKSLGSRVRSVLTFHSLNALLKNAKNCTLDMSELNDIQFELFYEDLLLTEETIAKLINSKHSGWWNYNRLIFPKSAVNILDIKSHINYMGGQFKISAEAGKGYTLTITFPIVTEDAHE